MTKYVTDPDGIQNPTSMILLRGSSPGISMDPIREKPDHRAAVLAVFLLALAVRLIPAAALLSSDEIPVVTDDPPYHLVRVMRLLHDPPGFREPDPLSAHPHGAVACWPWGFDLLLAGVCRVVLGASPSRPEVILVCSALIPVLGALAPVLLFLLGRRFATDGVAIAGAAVLAILPAHVDYSVFGRVDHHVLEPFIPLFGLAGPLCATRTAQVGLIRVVLSGLWLGLSLALIPAALPIALPVFLMAAGLWMGRSPPVAAWFGSATLFGAVSSLAASPHPLDFVFYSPSLLHVALIAPLAFGLGAGAVASRLGGRGLARWIGCAALAAIAAFGVLFLSLDEMRSALVQGMQYLHRQDFAVRSLEAQPLWSDPRRAVVLLTGLGPFALLGLHRLLSASGPTKGVRIAVGILTVGLLGLALFQRRFLVAASALYALSVAEGLSPAWFLATGARRNTAWVAGLAAFVVAGLAPSVHHLVTRPTLSAMDHAMTRAARLLAAAAVTDRARGVLAPWAYGHLFQFEAGLPTVCDNFFGPPENDRAMQTCLEVLYEEDQHRAASRLRELDLAFVVLAPPHPEQVRVEARLLRRDPDRYVGSDGSFRPAFANTLWGGLGLFAERARAGDRAPFGTRLVARLREVDAGSGAVEAEVLVFSVDAAEAP